MSETPTLTPPPSLPEESREIEKVGYRRPPVATRFKPGQSGNPGGRRKRSRTLSALLAAAFAETVAARENGRARRMTKLEAIVKQLVNKAAGGDHRIAQFLFALAEARAALNPPDERINPNDALVLAELVRRFGRQRE